MAAKKRTRKKATAKRVIKRRPHARKKATAKKAYKKNPKPSVQTGYVIILANAQTKKRGYITDISSDGAKINYDPDLKKAAFYSSENAALKEARRVKLHGDWTLLVTPSFRPKQ